MSRTLIGLTRRLSHRTRLNGLACSHCQGFATAAVTTADSATLPLAGIRVLDMTRVLAGVCVARKIICVCSLTIRKAILHSNTWRPRVGIVKFSRMNPSGLLRDTFVEVLMAGLDQGRSHKG